MKPWTNLIYTDIWAWPPEAQMGPANLAVALDPKEPPKHTPEWYVWCANNWVRHSRIGGPNDLFEISSNNSPDPPCEDDEVHEPQDHSGDYPLESDEGGEE